MGCPNSYTLNPYNLLADGAEFQVYVRDRFGAAAVEPLGVLSGPSPPWANRRRRSARLVSAVPAKQLYEEPNCTYTYGTSFSQKVYGASYRASSSSKPPRPIPRWNRLGASYTLGKTERRRRQAESGAEAKSSGRREKNVALAEIGRRAKSVLRGKIR